MFNDEQLQILKKCLMHRKGSNLVSIQDFGHSDLPQLVETVNEAQYENEVINQIENILYKNFSS